MQLPYLFSRVNQQDNFHLKKNQPILIIILFLGIVILLQTLYGFADGTWFQRILIEDVTVKTTASLINWVSPSIGVEAENTHLNAAGGGINVANGCNGLEVMFIFFAAMTIAPLNLYSKVLGLLFGIPYIFILNQIRLLALFFTYRMNKSFFSTLHSTVAPVLLMAFTILSFVYWLSRHHKISDNMQSKDSSQ